VIQDQKKISSAKNSIEKELASIKAQFYSYRKSIISFHRRDLSEAHAIIQDLKIRLEKMYQKD
jgi:hypothetical protein